MVNFELRTNIHRIADKITAPVVKIADAKWFAADIDIVMSDGLRGGTIIYDFNFSVSSIIEITLDGTNFAPINENLPLVGRQSRYLRVLNGDKVNFRAKTAGSINRIVVGDV